MADELRATTRMMKDYMKECNKEKHLKIKLEEAVEASEAEVSRLRVPPIKCT